MKVFNKHLIIGLLFLGTLSHSGASLQLVDEQVSFKIYKSIKNLFTFSSKKKAYQFEKLSLKANWPKRIKRKLRGKDIIRQSLEQNAASFNLPVEFFSCLVYRESRFDPLAQSHVGALGLGQIMKGTYKFLIVMLEQGRKNTQSYDRFRSVEAIKHSYRKNEKLSHITLWNHWVLRWGWEAERKLKELKRGYFVLKKPKMNLAVSATYLKYLKLRLLAENKVTTVNKQALLAISGAYNQGPRILFKNPKWSLNRMIKKYSRVDETRDYIKFISKCMNKWKPKKKIQNNLLTKI